MRHRSDIWVKLAARGRFSMQTKARINGVDYTAISAPKINRSLMSSPLSVGNCVSATLSVSVLTDDEISSAYPITIMGRLYSGSTYSEWLEFGTYYINQRDTSYEGLITLDCYDAMLKANQSYIEEGTDDSANWPKTQIAVVEEIAYRIGVGIDPRTRINTGDDYVVPYPSDKTMMQVLGYIAGCHGGNWIITEENMLRLVPLVQAPDETFRVISHDYENITTADGSLLIYKEQTVFNAELATQTGEQPESVIETTHYITDEYGNPIVTPDGYYLIWALDGSVDAVDGIINVPVVCGELTTGTTVVVSGISASDESGESYTAGDDSGYTLTIDSNPYMTQGICDDLYTAYNGLVYAPYTATKSCYDPAVELGDQVKISDKVHSVLYASTITLDIDYRADMSAPNSEELSEEYPYLTIYQRLKQSSEALNSAILQTAEELTDTIENNTADITSLANALVDEVERASGVETEINTRVADEETRAKAAEKELEDRIAALEDTVKSHTETLNEILNTLQSLTDSSE